jgi:squalene synthase HpnC
MDVTLDTHLATAYLECTALAKAHYENFPVASILLPKKIRQAVCVVYTFARVADDIADEGKLSSIERLAALDELQRQLSCIASNTATNLKPHMLALKDTIEKFSLPITLFSDLLIAFKQDVTQNRYPNFSQVLTYCQYSANPVGRILLHLTNNASQTNLIYSDFICSALQFINMLQDFRQDLIVRNRLYLPQADLAKFDLDEHNLLARAQQAKLREYISYSASIAKKLLDNGRALSQQVGGFFGLELRLMIKSAYTILEKVATNPNIEQRVTLSKFDFFKIFCKVILHG